MRSLSSVVPNRIWMLLESEYSNDKSYALSWAMNNLSSDELVDFYNYAQRYRPMMARQEQAMLDIIHDRILASEIRLAWKRKYQQDEIQHVGSYHFVSPEMQHIREKQRAIGSFKESVWNDVSGFKRSHGLGFGYDPMNPLGVGVATEDSMEMLLAPDSSGDSSGSSQTGMSSSEFNSLMNFLGTLGKAGLDLAASVRKGDRDAELAAKKMQYEFDLAMAKAKTPTAQNAAMAQLQAALAAANAKAQGGAISTNTILLMALGLGALMLMKK